MAGFTTYLSHLGFDKDIHLVDNTVVPISGTVYIGRPQGSDGFQSTTCPLKGATVCLHLKNGKTDDEGNDLDLECMETDHTGYYSFNAVVGTQ